ncbi:GNAT family N-acetyltransferase [Pseudalkalibacillus salsuginis]|uniref:GNAT family N-acetyltransferase n=1 Tax=Pseudalkalibacillus salsuginis TaxID=2910972 RepID=UPI001F351E77|nr:GNAT family N-acetyltransferase [Pseudalkalibacillus salsuginis]MCF6410433.1 GNAT family N-acetyltransferase [Pseudalkalibacillus salsuginis]
MELRTITEKEFDDFLAMGEFAFQYELSEEDKEKRRKMTDLGNCWAIFEQGKMASKLLIHPMEIWFGGKVMAMGGIAGVASWPDYRRKGHIKALMKKSLDVMRDNGQSVSMLHPFSVAFYRKYGWELTHAVKKYEIKPEQLAAKYEYAEGRVIRIAHDIERLDNIYAQYAKKYTGMLKRTEKWWRYSVLHDPRDIVAVYQDEEGTDKGYLIYRVKKNVMEIEEWVSLNEQAKLTMLQYVRNHDSMVDSINLHPAIDENFEFLMFDPKIKQEISSYFMSRIVDFKKFIEAYPFQTELVKPLIVHLDDPLAKWNRGTFIIKKSDDDVNKVDHFPPKEGARCQHPPEKGIQCDINTLSTMFFNYQTPRQLAAQGRLKGSPEEIEMLERMLPKHPPFLYDFF